MGKRWSPGFLHAYQSKESNGLPLQNVRHNLLGQTQEESEASISPKDKMLPAINGWYLVFLHNKPHSQWDGNSAWAGSCNFWQLLLLWWHGSQLLILPCARQKSVLLLSLASMLSIADLDSELLWSELSVITARQWGFSALMYSLLLTRMGKPGWRSKQEHDGHSSLFCPSDQMLSQSLFSSCFQGRKYKLSLSFSKE